MKSPLILVALLILPGAPGHTAQAGDAVPAQIQLLEIPEPNLEGADPRVAQQVLEELERARRTASDSGANAAQRSKAFGELGQTLLLYDLSEPAEAAFRNAATLMPADHKPSYYLGVISQDRGSLDEAREYFRAVLEIDPGYLSALVRLGDIDRVANRPEDSRAWYERALEVLPTSPAAHWGLGQLAVSIGDSQQAISHFEAVLEAQPEATATHYPLALAYRDLGQSEEARRHLSLRGEHAVRPLDPLMDGLTQRGTGASLAMKRGNSAYSSGNYEAAARAYREAVEAAPEDTTARHALATSLAQMGRTEEALEQLRIVVELKPESVVAHYNLGTMYSQLGDIEQAAQQFREALDLAPDLIDARFNLALLLERQGLLEQALEQYAEIQRQDPQDTSAVIRHSALQVQLGGADEAENQLRGILSVDPRNVEAQMALGGLFAATQRLPEALEQYELVLESAEDRQTRARAHFETGKLLGLTGDPAGAVEQLEKTVELMPGIVEARMTLAGALARSQRFEEAAEQFDVALGQRPELIQAHLGRARALLFGGRDSRAVESLEASLASLPGQIDLTQMLSRVLAASSDPEVRDGQRALRLAQSTLGNEPSPRYAETMAMALAELGRFEEAIQLQAQVHEAAVKTGDPEAARIERRLRQYENREPVRSPWLRADGP